MPEIERIHADGVPPALGNYSHAVRYEGLIIVSGIASRDAKSNALPGLVKDAAGKILKYDIELETRATLENIGRILMAAGSDWEHVLEVNTYLLDMRDFKKYNEVYAEFFTRHFPARTTLGVQSLPGDIHIEMKVVAVKK